MKMKKSLFCVMIIDMLLILGAIALNLYCIVRKNISSTTIVTSAITLCALICALTYLFYGFKKNAAKYFNWFVTMFTFSYFLSLLEVSQYSFITLRLLCAVSFGALCILAVARDVGRKKSYLLTGMVLISSIIISVYTFILIPRVPFITISHIVLSLVLGVMVYGKYEDKSARGSK